MKLEESTFSLNVSFIKRDPIYPNLFVMDDIQNFSANYMG